MNISRYLPFKLISNEDFEKLQKHSLREANLLVEVQELKDELRTVGEDNARLEREKRATMYPVIDFNMGDPSPVDSVQRALYVAQVAGLHKDILEPKLKQMISSTHQLLSEASNDRDFDQALKGALYFAWEFIRWGDRMVNEQVAIQQGDHPELSEK